MSETARTTNSMQVRLSHFGKIKIDDHVYCLNVNTAGKQIYKEIISNKQTKFCTSPLRCDYKNLVLRKYKFIDITWIIFKQ